MKFFRVLFCFLTTIVYFSSVSCIHFNNFDELMKQYYLLCGIDYFCSDRIGFDGRPISLKYKYIYQDLCPECTCDVGCLARGNCCPDLFFSFPELSCVNRTIIKGTDEENRGRYFSALLVSTCPRDSDEELRKKCTTLLDTKSRLSNLPVTGDFWDLSFYNKYCAECNGVTNYTSWNLDIDCKNLTDFNYMSSVDEITSAAFLNKCVFQVHSKVEKSEANESYCIDFNEKRRLISDCDLMNGSSLELALVSDIKQACMSSYRLKFRMFQNIFCLMCNPTKHNFKTKHLDTCNETGHWQNFDKDLQYACRSLPSSPYTQPYKNIFCYFCNRNNETNRPFLDVYGDVTETFDLHYKKIRRFQTGSNTRMASIYEYDLKINAFELTFFKNNLLSSINDGNELGKSTRYNFDISSFRDRTGVKINMTNLLLQCFALNGNKDVCKSRRLLLPLQNFGSCECEISCIFGQNPHNCCLDLALEIPVNCFDIGKFSDFSYPGFLTINGCFQEERYNIFEKECLNPKSDDIFSLIPVTKQGSINYANIYCALCNLESNKYVQKINNKTSNLKESESLIVLDKNLAAMFDGFSEDTKSYDIWNLLITCNSRLDYLHILTATDFFRLSRRIGCRVKYQATSSESELCTKRYDYTSCKNSSKWAPTDDDVEWACQNVVTLKAWNSKLQNKFPSQYDNLNYRNTDPQKVYRNFYCALCKPEIDLSELIEQNCTDSQFEDQCLTAPSVYYFYPFKNIYCAKCNGIENNSQSMPNPIPMTQGAGPPIHVGHDWFPVLRNVFSVLISVTEDKIENPVSDSGCGKNQVFDSYQDMCRNITCFSGKYLNGNSCLPLLQTSMNLRYSMRIQIGVYFSKSMTHVAYLPKSIEEFRYELETYLSMKGISSEITTTTQKFKKIGPRNNNICRYIRVEIFISTSSPRLFVENSLVKFKNTISNGCRKKRPTETITYRKLMNKEENKTEKSTSTSFNTKHKFFLAKVSEVLLCRQIKLSSNEYKIDEDSSKLILLKDDSELSYDEYEVALDGSLRICLHSLEEKNFFDLKIANEMDLIQMDYQLYYLWIISLVCSCISLISLLFSIIIYAICPSLQTTPGKLLIIMMISLFFTLFVLQITYFTVESRAACITSAVILHFSLLTVFTSMQSSNFHMFRTFTSRDPQRHTSGRFFDKTLAKYITYIIGFPLTLILCNVILAWFIDFDDNFGYGSRKCFINNNYRFLATFVVPIAFMCILNILFFLITMRAIHLTPNPQSSRQNRNELIIYIRLTSTTGISWLLQIIDFFLPLSPFSFVATSINSLQGFFIFLAFIVNKRMVTIIRGKLSKQKTDNKSAHTLTTGTTDNNVK